MDDGFVSLGLKLALAASCSARLPQPAVEKPHQKIAEHSLLFSHTDADFHTLLISIQSVVKILWGSPEPRSTEFPISCWRVVFRFVQSLHSQTLNGMAVGYTSTGRQNTIVSDELRYERLVNSSRISRA